MSRSNAYSLFLGCIIPASQVFVEKAMALVAEKLELRVAGLKGASCCPDPEVSRLVGYDAWVRVAARNLAIAEEKGLPLCAICNGCYDTLAKANRELAEDPQLHRQVNESLALIKRSYRLRVEVKHIIEVLYDDVGVHRLQGRVARRLRDVTAVTQPGCRLYREEEKRLPWKLDTLIETLGVQVLDYEARRLCCGVPSANVNLEFALQRRAQVKLQKIRAVKPDCIILVCPACHDMLEKAQLTLLEPEEQVPVLNLVEALALSFGYSPEEIGMDIHRIQPTELLSKLGLSL
ncbi:MAG: CoB--CoM heterodisulfide reductase iron-sulfur subunit B family protein [Candidatus Bathyarchaeia archaeon]